MNMMATEISNAADVIDSRDIVARIDDLREERDRLQELAQDDPDFEHPARLALRQWETGEDPASGELADLEAVAAQAEDSPGWKYGETLIRDSYFVEYTQELVDECYEKPVGFFENAWPWRYMTMDWEAAADELKSDYLKVDYDGVTYWIHG
jgi:hypothetical protein